MMEMVPTCDEEDPKVEDVSEVVDGGHQDETHPHLQRATDQHQKWK